MPSSFFSFYVGVVCTYIEILVYIMVCLSFQQWFVGHQRIKAVVDVENMVHFFPIINLAAAWFILQRLRQIAKNRKRQQLDGGGRKKGKVEKKKTSNSSSVITHRIESVFSLFLANACIPTVFHFEGRNSSK